MSISDFSKKQTINGVYTGLYSVGSIVNSIISHFANISHQVQTLTPAIFSSGKVAITLTGRTLRSRQCFITSAATALWSFHSVFQTFLFVRLL